MNKMLLSSQHYIRAGLDFESATSRIRSEHLTTVLTVAVMFGNNYVSMVSKYLLDTTLRLLLIELLMVVLAVEQ